MSENEILELKGQKGCFVHLPFEVKQDPPDGEGDRIIEGFASTEHLDRGGDITHAEAFKKTLARYMKNPILLYNHMRGAVLGSIEKAEIRDGKGLWVRAKLVKDDPNVDRIWNLIKQRALRAFSFGFQPKDSREETTTISGGSGNPWSPDKIRHLDDLELFEVSVVDIPMNAYAGFSLAKALKFGSDVLLETNSGFGFAPVYPDEEPVTENRGGWVFDPIKGYVPFSAGDFKCFVASQKVLKEAGIQAPTVRFTVGDPDQSDFKKAVPKDGYPPADAATPWRFTASDENAILGTGDNKDWKTFKTIHAWFNSKAGTVPKVKSAYKLPHHKKIGDTIKTVWRGVAAAGAVLMGARGGVNIPSTDVAGTKRHLEAHYKQFDKKPPWSEKELADEYLYLIQEKEKTPEIEERLRELEEKLFVNDELKIYDDDHMEERSVDIEEEKAGRALSKVNYARVQKIKNALGVALPLLEELLAAGTDDSNSSGKGGDSESGKNLDDSPGDALGTSGEIPETTQEEETPKEVPVRSCDDALKNVSDAMQELSETISQGGS